MSKDQQPEQKPWGMPCIVSPNVQESIRFYEKAFGFQLKEQSVNEEGGPFVHAQMVYREQIFFLTQESVEDREQQAPITTGDLSPIWFYLYCDNVDQYYQQALAEGAISQRAPNNMSWGDKMCTLVDIHGYRWSFGTPVERCIVTQINQS